ncbi:MAG: hypothetical protein COZ69_07435 [Deltaproteobacteria bacterium CG_4_8_14_3_um_filter_45_9]|jgi:hypothetical protein|nr:MAG: hypothetical protein COZ69_07435 [Deltaproteobacteria bacterium CG_4_8_14_3_um_filter_45_9]
MKSITLETIYKKVVNLQRDVTQIKKNLMEEPELREDFILRMRELDLEKSITVEDFGKRYGLK